MGYPISRALNYKSALIKISTLAPRFAPLVRNENKVHLEQNTGVEAVGSVVMVHVHAYGVQVLQRALYGRVERKPEVFFQRLVTRLNVKVQVLDPVPHYAAVGVHVLRFH